MKKILAILAVLLALCIGNENLLAQPGKTLPALTPPTNDKGWYESKDLEHLDIGWLETIQYKQPPKTVVKNGWIYPAIQTAFIQKTVMDWQKNYMPKGLLGDMVQSILAPETTLPVTNASYDFNEAEKDSKKALPNTYGAFARMHKCLVKTKTHKFYPMPGNWCEVNWNIMANNVELFSRQMVYLSSPDEYYCIQPRYTVGMKGQYEKDWMNAETNYRDFTNSPNLKKYDHYMRQDANMYVVIITKDGKPLPFEHVTMGEFIARLETQLPRTYKLAVNMKVRSENLLANAQKGIQVLKNKYKNQLNDPVYITNPNQNIDCLDLAAIEEGKDITWLHTELLKKHKSGWIETGFPLLRLKTGIKQACATSGPQWIVCTLDKVIDQSFAGSADLMDNFVSRFNYDYLYEFYFGKQPNEPYKPASFVTKDVKNNSQAATPLSENAKRMASDKSIVFFDDFSTVAVNAKPANWNSQITQSGDVIGVSEIDGVSGKWLKLKRTASPKNLSLNLNEDFEFSVDLLVQKGDVPWGTPGIQIELPFATSTGDKKLNLDISPGDMNRKDAAGWVMLSFGGSECKITNYYSLSDFKGSGQVNQASMMLRKKGNTITFLCNDKTIYECATAFNPDMRLKGLSFTVNEKNVYHLGNIKIKKL